MGSYGCVLIETCSSIEEHRGFEVQLFQNPNGVVDNVNNFPIRMVLSSYLHYFLPNRYMFFNFNNILLGLNR
jgi:hypothetical protein